ncbi:MAG: hypothetical protein HRT69_00580 [Flavobacteriaceae bacterium]|nr:hypothetical protein [Flavobacteriaceae bacterium]
MRSYIVVMLLIINFCALFGQNKDADKLKKYVSCTEKDHDSWGWTKKHFFNDEGFIIKEENYSNDNKLRSRYEYYYDEYGNQYKEINTFNSNDGVLNHEYDYKLVVDSIGVIIQRGSGDFMKIYSNFTELGKPRLVVNKFSVGVDKKIYEYDVNGNIVKYIYHSVWTDMDEKVQKSTESIQYRYDSYNNVIRLYRSNDQKWEYPMIITGGPSHYEHEKFRYVYNRDGLWKKKFKTVEGKEYLIKKRKYTKR